MLLIDDYDSKPYKLLLICSSFNAVPLMLNIFPPKDTSHWSKYTCSWLDFISSPLTSNFTSKNGAFSLSSPNLQ